MKGQTSLNNIRIVGFHNESNLEYMRMLLFIFIIGFQDPFPTNHITKQQIT